MTFGYYAGQVGEIEPFISELLNSLTETIKDLEVHQINMFYEAVALMISADADPKHREEYLVRFSTCDFLLTVSLK